MAEKRKAILMIRTKRVYEKPSRDDGRRVLVDRLWPRGFSKREAKVDFWLKEIGPSDELRKWFGHDPAKWEQFKKRYFAELAARRDMVDRLLDMAREGDLTLVYSAKDQQHNQAVALKEYLEKAVSASRRRAAAA